MSKKKGAIFLNGETPNSANQKISKNRISLFVIVFMVLAFALFLGISTGEKRESFITVKETSLIAETDKNSETDILNQQLLAQKKKLEDITAKLNQVNEQSKEQQKENERLRKLQEEGQRDQNAIKDKLSQLEKKKQAFLEKGNQQKQEPVNQNKYEKPTYKMPDRNISPDGTNLSNNRRSTGKPSIIPLPPPNDFSGVPNAERPIQGGKVVDTVVINNKPKPKGNSFSGLTGSPLEKTQSDYSKQEKIEVNSRYVENSKSGYLPANSFANIVLLTGAEVSTGADTQENPTPVSIRVQSDAIISDINGKHKFALKGCTLTGSAFGDMSTSRVKIKTTEITCVDSSKNWVLNSKINGYIVDSNGEIGLAGELIDRTGDLMIKSAAASAADSTASIANVIGGGVALGNSVSSMTNGNVPEIPSLSQVGKGIGYGAVGSTAKTIGDRYKEQLDSIVPFISVEKGRKGTFVLLQGTNLKWESMGGMYKKQVTPAQR